MDVRCTVGLLTWNAGEDGARCVRSVLGQTEHAYIDWVDNASVDGTVERLKEQFEELPPPRVNGENLGFCAPHNAMIARCMTPYYLALNQDVVLAPEYIRRLCDWMDCEADLALTGGLMLLPTPALGQLDPETWQSLFQGYIATIDRQRTQDYGGLMPLVHSAGLVSPHPRYFFQLGEGKILSKAFATARRVPGVDGAAMMIKVAACRQATLDGLEIFPERFFAYVEEIDLAMRLARVGLACGVDSMSMAVHRGKGSGGHAKTAIRARYLANHWLLSLRQESWGMLLGELPYIVKGELHYWMREYLDHPAAAALGLLIGLREAWGARRFYRAFEKKYGPTREGLERYKRESLEALRSETREG